MEHHMDESNTCEELYKVEYRRGYPRPSGSLPYGTVYDMNACHMAEV
jgi:hypothetical protein